MKPSRSESPKFNFGNDTYRNSQRKESSRLLSRRLCRVTTEVFELQKIYLTLLEYVFEGLSADRGIFQIRE